MNPTSNFVRQQDAAQKIMIDMIKEADEQAMKMGLIRCPMCSIQDSLVYHAPPECCLKDKKEVQ
jgi:hypothetical protein